MPTKGFWAPRTTAVHTRSACDTVSGTQVGPLRASAVRNKLGALEGDPLSDLIGDLHSLHGGPPQRRGFPCTAAGTRRCTGAGGVAADGARGAGSPGAASKCAWLAQIACGGARGCLLGSCGAPQAPLTAQASWTPPRWSSMARSFFTMAAMPTEAISGWRLRPTDLLLPNKAWCFPAVEHRLP